MRTWLLVGILLFLPSGGWASEGTEATAAGRGEDEISRELALKEYRDSHVIETTLYEGSAHRVAYGDGQPVLVCAPLRICSIILEPGETILDLVPGDLAHWEAFELRFGGDDGGLVTPVVGVRTLLDLESGDTCDKTTSLVITTTRRLYTVLLQLNRCIGEDAFDSNPDRPFYRSLEFFFPKKRIQRINSLEKVLADQAKKREAASGTRVGAAGVEALNWDYWMSGRFSRFPWRPSIFDDGERTFIRLPETARELPVVFDRSNGGDEVINASVSPKDRSMLILPGVYESLVLVAAGKGTKTKRLNVVNRGGEQ